MKLISVFVLGILIGGFGVGMFLGSVAVSPNSSHRFVLQPEIYMDNEAHTPKKLDTNAVLVQINANFQNGDDEPTTESGIVRIDALREYLFVTAMNYRSRVVHVLRTQKDELNYIGQMQSESFGAAYENDFGQITAATEHHLFSVANSIQNDERISGLPSSAKENIASSIWSLWKLDGDSIHLLHYGIAVGMDTLRPAHVSQVSAARAFYEEN